MGHEAVSHGEVLLHKAPLAAVVCGSASIKQYCVVSLIYFYMQSRFCSLAEANGRQ